MRMLDISRPLETSQQARYVSYRRCRASSLHQENLVASSGQAASNHGAGRARAYHYVVILRHGGAQHGAHIGQALVVEVGQPDKDEGDVY